MSNCPTGYFTDYNSSLIKESDELRFKYIQNRMATFLNFKQPQIDFKIDCNESALFDENFAFNLTLVNNELNDM